MRRNNLVVLLVAIIMGGVAAYMTRSWIQSQTLAAPVAGTIVVAAAPLGFGTVLNNDNVAEIPWAGGKIPEAAFATKEDLFKEGRRSVLTPMERSELILRSKVTGPGQRASLSALLEDGKRAVTVRVDDVRGVAGFVLPGDRVDVVLTRTEPRLSGGSETFSDVLVESVKVLAVDQLANERQEQPTVAKAVTLEVTTEQAQKIVLATTVGKLALILRQAGEANPSLARRITESDLGLVERKDSAAPVQGTAIVEIVRGTKGQKYDVKRVGAGPSLSELSGEQINKQP